MTIENDKKLKTASYGLTIGEQTENGDIFFVGLSPETLKSANSFFPNLPSELDLAQVIAPGNLFFYKIEHFDTQKYPQRELLACETGIGETHKNEFGTFLRRSHPKYQFTKMDGWSSIHKNLNFDKNARLIVTTHPPTKVEDLFSIKDTVLCSIGDGLPEIVPIRDGEVLSKINGDIRSASLGDVFAANSCPFIIPSNKLELTAKDSTVYCNAINLKSQRSRPQNVPAGTIIFNNRKKVFEGFDGEQWRTLKWE